jgi:acyl-CoA thioesterase-1
MPGLKRPGVDHRSELMVTALLFLALITALPAQAGASKPSVPLKIVAFGDSLTSGHKLPQKDAYPAVIQKKLKSAGLPYTVVNQGLSGDTTRGALRRLDRALAEKPQIVIVELGVNDGLRGVPVPEIKANLEQIIAAAREQNAEVLLCAMEALPLHGWQYTIEFHEMYEDLAMKYGVPMVPFLMNGVLGNPDMIGDDGVHPNAAGARFIADTIWEYLEPMARKIEKDSVTTPGTR